MWTSEYRAALLSPQVFTCVFGSMPQPPNTVFIVRNTQNDTFNKRLRSTIWHLLPDSANLFASYDTEDEAAIGFEASYRARTRITDATEIRAVVDEWRDSITQAIPGVGITSRADSGNHYTFTCTFITRFASS